MTDTARRIQLTLFVPHTIAEPLEAVRRQLDPVQSQLIAAHVTLCREDELAFITDDEITSRVAAWRDGAITLTFGSPVSFGGHGVLLPCVDGQSTFQRLRKAVLGTEHVRASEAHLTLAHPRNPRAHNNTDAVVAELAERFAPSFGVTFTAMSLIEQRDGAPWRTLRTMPLVHDAQDSLTSHR